MTHFFYHQCKDLREVEEFGDKTEVVEIRRTLLINSGKIIIDRQLSPGSSDVLKKLINRDMNTGDDLVILDLNSLGNNAEMIQENIIRCAKKAIRIHCYFPQKKLTPTVDGYIFTLLLPKIQNECRKVNLSALKTRNITRPLGRTEGSKYRESIELAKRRGLTQSQTAKELDISISTVKRNWNSGIIG
ncbi:ECF sigma factor family protein [Yersinia rohdei]|uniref:ECF sigma factor family protein n=1 Tax=Yersinia rohdei TaxID=29485 RepID=A0ABM5S9I8_YERRO|nr:ECF-type sigma factor [Yersinia rohdei]AJJ09856.1 ECF sigma factor family protein [Yersinia rohdei]